jgi:hypothetical protein
MQGKRVGLAVAGVAAMVAWSGCGSSPATPSPERVQVNAAAFTQSNFVSFTLEGCRNDGSITLPINGKFVCPDAAYTTGNLGKGWNELDLVPHRLTTQLGNQGGATTTYDVYVAADNQTGGRTGYDVIAGDGGNGTLPVVNTSKSDASCSIVVGPQSTQGSASSPFGGGTDVVIYRQLTITQNKGTTCVIDYFQRLALGSHLYPGSSLQSYMFEQQGLSGSKKTISIPVNQILPQELAKTMEASQGVGNDWTVTKSTPNASKSFGNTCATDAPTSLPVSITVTWTKSTTATGDISITSHITATNPASRTITVNVTDTIYTGLSGGTAVTAITGSNPYTFPPFDVGPNSNVEVDHTITVAAGTADAFNDIAIATYTDKVTNIEVPGNTQATASASVDLVTSTDNATATITDTEHITDTVSGLTFSVDSPAGTYVHASGITDTNDLLSALLSPSSYTLGTPTTDYVRWTSATQSGSGSVTFNKTVYRPTPTAGHGFVTTGELDDEAGLTGTVNTFTRHSAVVGIDIGADAIVKLTISKSIPAGVITGTTSQTFTFDVCKNGPATCTASDTTNFVQSVDIAFAGTDIPILLTKTADVTNLAPSVYTVTERAASGWNLSGGVAQAVTKTVDLSVQTDGSVACSGTASFTNAIGPAKAQVAKITVPAGHEDAGFAYALKFSTDNVTFATIDTIGTPNDCTVASPCTFSVDLNQSGYYKITETMPSFWENTESSGCTFTVTLPTNADHMYTCTFTNTEWGTVSVQKTENGGTPTHDWTFNLYSGGFTMGAPGVPGTPPSSGNLLEPPVVANAGDSYKAQFTSHLYAGSQYTICEMGVGAGWSNAWNNVTQSGVNDIYCYSFTFDAAWLGGDHTFTLDNVQQQGGQRTIGYWKNWSTCGGNANVAIRAERTGNTLLDEVLSSINVPKVNGTGVLSCQDAVELLDKRTITSPYKKMASDPGFGLAAQLIAAEANVAIGAGLGCGTVVGTNGYIAQAKALLGAVNNGNGFNGTAKTNFVDATQAALANSLAAKLDYFNNGGCPQ